VGVIRFVGWGSGHQPNAGGRIMRLTRERLFGAPTVVRRAEERIERGRVAVSAARARATEIARQCAAQPRLRPNGLQRRRLERVNGTGIGPVVKSTQGSAESGQGTIEGGAAREHPRQGREINL